MDADRGEAQRPRRPRTRQRSRAYRGGREYSAEIIGERDYPRSRRSGTRSRSTSRCRRRCRYRFDCRAATRCDLDVEDRMNDPIMAARRRSMFVILARSGSMVAGQIARARSESADIRLRMGFGHGRRSETLFDNAGCGDRLAVAGLAIWSRCRNHVTCPGAVRPESRCPGRARSSRIAARPW